MSRKVAIVGTAQTKHKERNLQVNVRELVYEVTKEVLEKTGLSREDIDTMVEASDDYWDGRGCSNVYTFEACGAYLKEESKVEDDGAIAFLYAYMRILSGHFDVALVVSHTKCSEAPPLSTLTNIACDPIFQRPIGLDSISAAALQAHLYMHKYGITEEQAAKVSVKNLGNALNNPYAHRKMKITVKDVLKSPVMAYPLRALNCCPSSDGACAIILASEDRARKITDTPAWIKGADHRVDSYYMGDRNLVRLKPLKVAARNAYKMAGIKNPRKEIDVAEVSEPYSFQELLWYEHLGFCKEGEGGKLIDDGVTEMNGELPVNPSGGVLSTSPYVARGLIRVAEAALQVTGKAGKHQVPGAEVALAHAMGGLAGQLQCVVILSAKS